MRAAPQDPLPFLLTALLALAGCRAPGEGEPTPPPPLVPRVGPAPPASFAIRSPAFGEGDHLPRAFTCDDRNASPPLTWEATPPGTRSLALIAEDPDAPGATFVHWVVWGIPPSTRALAEGEKLAGGAREGRNGFGAVGWGGPCPPPGPAHRYHFRLYALDVVPDLTAGSPVLHLHAVMFKHILAESVLTARYGRAPR